MYAESNSTESDPRDHGRGFALAALAGGSPQGCLIFTDRAKHLPGSTPTRCAAQQDVWSQRTDFHYESVLRQSKPCLVEKPLLQNYTSVANRIQQPEASQAAPTATTRSQVETHSFTLGKKLGGFCFLQAQQRASSLNSPEENVKANPPVPQSE